MDSIDTRALLIVISSPSLLWVGLIHSTAIS
uniref:Uncharacterized protein n=1 Tax=Arundo donax TaxID=35708 RepID=A0A0A9BV25_ARUDO